MSVTNDARYCIWARTRDAEHDAVRPRAAGQRASATLHLQLAAGRRAARRCPSASSATAQKTCTRDGADRCRRRRPGPARMSIGLCSIDGNGVHCASGAQPVGEPRHGHVEPAEEAARRSSTASVDAADLDEPEREQVDDEAAGERDDDRERRRETAPSGPSSIPGRARPCRRAARRAGSPGTPRPTRLMPARPRSPAR